MIHSLRADWWDYHMFIGLVGEKMGKKCERNFRKAIEKWSL